MYKIVFNNENIGKGEIIFKDKKEFADQGLRLYIPSGQVKLLLTENNFLVGELNTSAETLLNFLMESPSD